MAPATIFITGTDTGVGKTLVATGVLLGLRDAGCRAAGFKPLASGARRTPAGLRNDDALALLAASAPGLDYMAVNPWCFEPPIAPHLAAREAGVELHLDALDRAHDALAAQHQRVVVEGAGGWLVPLNDRDSTADWVARRGWPVLLVVGMRLGCINHALLSAEAIARRAPLLGWVANVLPPAQDRLEQNLQALCERMPAPLLAVIPEGATAQVVGGLLRGKLPEPARA